MIPVRYFRSQPDVHETLLWRSALTEIGLFAVDADEPDFETAGQIGGHPTIALPLTSSIWIRKHGQEPFVADRQSVVFYNVGDAYERFDPSEGCDKAGFFHFAGDLLEEVITIGGSAGRLDRDRPFSISCSRIDDRTFATGMSLLDYLRSTREPDTLLTEECAVSLLQGIASASPRETDAPRVTEGHRRLAERTREYLSIHFGELEGLAEVAGSVGCSVGHLCRTFRAVVGTTLHRYRQSIRLREGFKRVVSGSADLSATAHDLGFSSHSHFTDRFVRTFGITPSRLRESSPRQRLRVMSGAVHDPDE